MSQNGRIYTNRITMNPPPDSADGGSINLYAVAGDPSGVLDAEVGDRAFEIGSSKTWVCTGGTAWEELAGGVPALSVVIRPSAPDPTAGVYATFEAAHAAAVELVTTYELPVTIYVDEYDNAIDVFTAGTYDFYSLIDIQSYSTRPYAINTYAGVVFTRFQRGFSTGELYHDGPDALVTIAGGAVFEEYNVGPRGGFLSLDVGPVYDFTDVGEVARLNLQDSSYTLGGPSVRVADGATLVINLYPGSTLVEDTVSGGATAVLTVTYLWDSEYRAQPSFTGTLTRVGQYPTPSYAQALPAVSTPIAFTNSPATQRFVFGSVNLAASGGNAASINWQVETGEGTGVYTTVQTFSQPAGDTTQRVYSYAFLVPGGRRYQWTRGGLGGTTETLNLYSFVDSYAT